MSRVDREGRRNAQGKQAGTSTFRQRPEAAVWSFPDPLSGPDGRMRTGPDTYGRKSDAERALTLIEAQMMAGEWTDPERGKVKLADYAATWIAERPGLRVRTVDLYYLASRQAHCAHLGAVPIGKLSTPMIRKWRADLLDNGVSVSMAAKAYRLLRAVLRPPWKRTRSCRATPAASVARARSTPPNGRCSRLLRSSSWLSGSAVDRSAISASFRLAATGCASAGTARCVPQPRCTARGPMPSERCGRWRRMAGPCTMITGSVPWCCSPPSRACGGARSPRCGAVIWTWTGALWRIRAA